MPTKRKDKKGRVQWFGLVKIQSKQFTKKCESKDEALLWELSVKADQAILQTQTDITLLGLSNAYLDDRLAKGLGEASYREKRLVFQRLGKDIPITTPVAKVTSAAIERHLARIARTISGNRANKTRMHLIAAYRWGERRLSLPSPCPWRVDSEDRFKEEQNERRVPTEAEFWQVYDLAGEFQLLLFTFLHTAARKQEILSLKWNDIDFERKTIRLWTRKRKGGREYDLIPMTAELNEGLNKQRFKTGLQKYVFINPRTGTRYKSLSKIMERLCAAAEVEKFGFHGIRHLTASILGKSGVPLISIQAILRHKNLTTTAGYIHSLTGATDVLSDALGKRKAPAKTRAIL